MPSGAWTPATPPSAPSAATSEYGTPRANGTWLFELALNMKSPTIYDTFRDGDREERVVNQEETLAAREKQKLIKERFRSWIFTDPERTERLVRLYNDTYNNLRPRLFDGSHLDFPGMNQTIRLRPHQDDAVWRGMSSGNTLLAHAVGAGKTFTMAATGMKMKQAGLIKKPMYVVPNHLLEQFAREFMQLYPNARLLVAAKEDLTRDRRKFLTAKIASGEWDGIIVTHSSFERIGMSLEYQEKFLRRANRRIRRVACASTQPTKAATATSSRPSRSRRPRGANASRTCSPRTRRMTGWYSTSSASITSSSTRRIISRIWRRRPRWTASPASRPEALSGPSTSI